MGTWEQPEAVGTLPDGSAALSNKIEGGNADQRSQAAGAGEKFRASIAPIAAVQALDLVVAAGGELVDQGADPLQLTRQSGNGGNLPLSACLVGHVGRRLLEGHGQGVETAPKSGQRQKLRQLARARLAGQLAAELEQLLDAAQGTAAADLGEAPPGPPNAIAALPGMLALDVERIWIDARTWAELAAKRPISGGHSTDWLDVSVGKNAQNWVRRRGPGGKLHLGRPDKRAVWARNGGKGRRAGVNLAPLNAWSHETGELLTLRPVSGAVKRPSIVAVENVA